ncbi:MAG: M42 family metallopeptidase [Candidatus Omnitrophota bacterium]
MREESLAFLKTLLGIASPSGYEQEAIRVWMSRVKRSAKKITIDPHGNAIAVLNENAAPKVMLAGHIDEIGFMVKYIDEKGFVYFSAIGGIDPHVIPGRRVRIMTKKGNVTGVVGKRPPSSYADDGKGKIAKIKDFWIDIGAASREEAASLCSIGDVAVAAAGLELLYNDTASARGFDDRAGAFVVAEVLRQVSGKKLACSLYGVATVQEEIGLRGAQTSAYGIDPDIGIAVDVTGATDTPGMEKAAVGDIRIGRGPVIARGPNINPRVFDRLVRVAGKEKIPYQVQALAGGSRTDANVIQLTRSGVAAGLVSIPLRYGHTPVELLSLNDLENAVKLLRAFVLGLSAKFSTTP